MALRIEGYKMRSRQFLLVPLKIGERNDRIIFTVKEEDLRRLCYDPGQVIGEIEIRVARVLAVHPVMRRRDQYKASGPGPVGRYRPGT